MSNIFFTVGGYNLNGIHFFQSTYYYNEKDSKIPTLYEIHTGDNIIININQILKQYEICPANIWYAVSKNLHDYVEYILSIYALITKNTDLLQEYDVLEKCFQILPDYTVLHYLSIIHPKIGDGDIHVGNTWKKLMKNGYEKII